jgi:hypothetical protein
MTPIPSLANKDPSPSPTPSDHYHTVICLQPVPPSVVPIPASPAPHGTYQKWKFTGSKFAISEGLI